MANLGFWLIVGGFWLSAYLHEKVLEEEKKNEYKKRFMFPFIK